jgi:hypothetical protein
MREHVLVQALLLTLGIIGFVAAFGIFIVLPRRYTTSHELPSNAQPAFRVIGGGWWFGPWWYWSVTWPLARFEVFDAGIRMGASHPLLKVIVPTTEVPWDAVVGAGRSFYGVRVRLVANGKRQTLLFYPFGAPSGVRDVLLRIIYDHNVGVDP